VGGPQDELRSIAAGIRTHLEARAREGLVGVSRAPCPRINRAGSPDGAAHSNETPHPLTDPADVEMTYAADSDPPLPRGGHGLTLVHEELGDCQRCKLSRSRRHIVFGVGNPEAHLMFVGEGPGADEDEQGEPFVGAAGQLLTKMIQAMQMTRDDVYICNVIKCRPPSNRDPEPDEVAACEPFLKKQIAVVQPRVIVALGKFAAHLLTGEQTPITRLRGNLKHYQGIPVMPTYHPAYLLRDESRKREAWHDLKEVLALLKHMGL
jgi:uracil-DNA glycosylase